MKDIDISFEQIAAFIDDAAETVRLKDDIDGMFERHREDGHEPYHFDKEYEAAKAQEIVDGLQQVLSSKTAGRK